MKWLSYIVIAISLFFGIASADNNEAIKDKVLYQDYEVKQIADVEEIFEKTEFQFILGFFGKEYLASAVSDITVPANVEKIRNLSVEEVRLNSKSFANWSKGWYVLKHILVVFVFLGFLYFMKTLLTSTVMTMSEGKLYGGKVPLASYVIHTFLLFICLIQFLVVEINEPSYIERFIFKKLGSSFVVADESLQEYNNNISTGLPTVKIPRPFIYKDDMFNLINGLMEEKSVLKNESELEFKFTRLNEKYVGGLNGIKGDISFSLPIDTVLVKNQSELGNTGILNYYDQKVESVYRKIINKANTITDNVMSQEVNSWFKSDNTDFRWVSGTCANYEEVSLENASATSIRDYIQEASKCLSKDLVSSLTAIPNYDYDKVIRGDYGLRGNTIQLCGVVEESFGKRQVNTMTVAEIQACMTQYCSDGDTSSVFSCSLATNLYLKADYRAENSKKGFFNNLIMSPYYSIMKIDSNPAKSVINGLAVLEEEPDLVDTTTFSIVIDTKHYPHFNHETYLDFIKDNGASIVDGIQFQSISEVSFSDLITGFDGPFGLTRFQTCLNNPNSITNGYVCDNIFSEMNAMGESFLVNALAIKTASPFISSLLKKKNKTIPAKLLGGGNVKQKIRSAAVKGSLGIAGGATTIALFSFLDNTGQDYFYGWDDNIRENAPELAAFIITLSVLEEKFGISLTNKIFFVLVVFGILIGYIFPLVPFIIAAFIVIKIAAKIYESFIAVVLNFIFAINPSQKDRSEYLIEAFLNVVSLILIPLFAVMAIVIFNIMTQDIIPRFKIFETDSSYATDGSSAQIILFVVYAILNVYFLFRLVNYVGGTLKNFLDNSNSMIYNETKLGQAEEINDGKDEVTHVAKRFFRQ